MLIEQLNNASLAKPFEVLGLQKKDGKEGYTLTVWLPGALAVKVKSIDCK